eukprot:4078563-Amphidinium_carterae.1
MAWSLSGVAIAPRTPMLSPRQSSWCAVAACSMRLQCQEPQGHHDRPTNCSLAKYYHNTIQEDQHASMVKA